MTRVQEQLGEPISNAGENKTEIPQNLAHFKTLTEGLEYAAQSTRGLHFFSVRGKLEASLSYKALQERAQKTARRLLSFGFARGERVGLIAHTCPEFMEAFFACQYAGLLPCPLPYSLSLGGADAYRTRLSALIGSAAPRLIIASEEASSCVSAACVALKEQETIRVLTYQELGQQEEAPLDLCPFLQDEMAYIQYSSGSTASPKGILISQQAIVANTQAILNHGLKITPEDRAFSWLPLYHDMGLVGFFLSPLMGQVDVDYLPTHAFARRPALWLELISERKTTVSYAPSFGYDLAARRSGSSSVPLDLSKWRVAGIGGDMVRFEVLERFSNALEPYGFRSSAFVPSYGMAEATLAVTFGALDTPLAIDRVDRVQCETAKKAIPLSLVGEETNGSEEKIGRARDFILCGTPLPGYEIKIINAEGKTLKDREIGEICISSPSLMNAYFNNPNATAQVLQGGFLKTGDLGYWLSGQLVVTGRLKEMILHNGRNIWPQDIEWTAEQIAPLKSGDVAAFAVEDQTGQDQVVLLVQCRLSAFSEREILRRSIFARVREQIGFEGTVVLIPPKSLPFTSSGKLSRRAARESYLKGEFEIFQACSETLSLPSAC